MVDYKINSWTDDDWSPPTSRKCIQCGKNIGGMVTYYTVNGINEDKGFHKGYFCGKECIDFHMEEVKSKTITIDHRTLNLMVNKGVLNLVKAELLGIRFNEY